MNKRLLTIIVTGTVLTLGALAPTVNAQDIDSQINNANTQIENINSQKKAVESEVAQLSQELTSVQTKISNAQAEQATTKAKLESLQSEISKLENLIAERQERLQEQARAVQVNGARSYLDFLLNADSFTDFVNRLGVAVDVMGANRQLMQEQARDKAQVEVKEQEQKANLAQQQRNEATLQNLETELNDTFTKHKATLTNLSDEEVSAIAERDGLVKEKERILAEKAAAEAEKAAAQKAAEEAAAAMRKVEEDKIAAAAATTAAATVSTPTTQAAQAAQPSTQAATVASPIVGGGNFAAPDPTFVAALNGGYFGQCTYFVYNRFAQLGAPISTRALGNAAEWPANAARAGYAVSSTPRAGTAVVFQRGLGGADPVYGHVAFVERVNADGSIFVTEMNVYGVNVISTRTVPANIAAQAQYINFGL